VKELQKPAHINFKKRKVIMKEIDDTWQIDLVKRFEMEKFASEKKGFRYLLTIIDTFSKYAWAVPVKQ
jgi:hypothetical protein